MSKTYLQISTQLNVIFVIEDKLEMKKHMRRHSYINASYKCLDCDFICETDLGMEVHIGKEHADGFDCGLCGFKEQSLENLETHISSREVYDCGHCDDSAHIFLSFENC